MIVTEQTPNPDSLKFISEKVISDYWNGRISKKRNSKISRITL